MPTLCEQSDSEPWRRHDWVERTQTLLDSFRRWLGRELIPLDASPATAHMFIIQPFSGGGVMKLFSTHPPTEERIARLAALRGRV